MASKIKPRTVKGFRDIFRPELEVRKHVLDIAIKTSELYGYEPIETPALEYLDILLGGEYGEEGVKQIYSFEDVDAKKVGLRFDLTVPLARVYSQYDNLSNPYKRYQVGYVWRADKPDPGRFRQFMQFDLDIVGAQIGIAEIEILAPILDIFSNLGLDSFQIKVNSRNLMNAILEYANIPEDLHKSVIRVIDKLPKIGYDEVFKELTVGRVDKSGDKITGVGLSESQAEKIVELLKKAITGRKEVIDFVKNALSSEVSSKYLAQGLFELSLLNTMLDSLGIGPDKVIFDISLARGLDYYSGIVFEGTILGYERYGSVFGGGRYDHLVSRFKDSSVPAVGGSIGIDRLTSLLYDNSLIKLSTSPIPNVIVLILDDNLIPKYLEIVSKLRQEGISAELYPGTQKKIAKQLQYADKRDIPVAVILGEDENKKGLVSIKNLYKGRKEAKAYKERKEYLEQRPGQETIRQSELVPKIKEILTSIGLL